MKERAITSETSKPKAYKRRNFPISKRWIKVNSGSHPNDLKGFNESIELIYHRILKTVKEQYLEPQKTYFERDYKYDFKDPFSLHSFCCDQFFFRLECDFLCHMRIEYDFHNFEHEDEVMKLLRYAISRYSAFHKPHEPNLPIFFQGVVSYQPKQYIQTL